MGRTGLLLASAALVALAANVQGTGGDEVLVGTESREVIIPFDGNDEVHALGGNGDVRHSFGDDVIYGGAGAMRSTAEPVGT